VIDEEQGPISLDDIRARNDAVMPIDRPTRPMVPVRRRGLVAVAAAAVVLLVVGGLALLTLVGGSESPVATTPPSDPVSSSTWSRVPHDEAVFGGDGAQEMSGVTVGGPGLVAVGSDGFGALETYLRTRPWGRHAAVWTSTDGITWSRVPHDESVFGGGGMRSVVAGGPGLVAVGVGDTSVAAVWTSVDGITWSRVPHDEAVFGGEGNQEMNSVTAGGPGLVAVGVGGTPASGRLYSRGAGAAAVWTSVDGLTWSRVPHDEAVFGPASNQEMNSVTAGGPGLVAVGWDGIGDFSSVLRDPGSAVVWTSVDGITWSRVPHDESVFGPADKRQKITSVTVGGPGLVAVGTERGQDEGVGVRAAVWTSVDGITWSRVPHDEAVFGAETSQWMWSVTAGGPGLVAIGNAFQVDGAHAAAWKWGD
jgi:hypothetical protein